MQLFPPLPNREFRKVWEIENPRLRWTLARRARTAKIGFYQTMSPRFGDRIVECIEIRNGFGLRMAWIFLRHGLIDLKPTTEITELFVWPIFRRIKFGTFLEQWAVTRAQDWGSVVLQLVMNADDGIIGPPSPRTAARCFGSSLGYSWRWASPPGPRIAAVGVKRI